jgi:hypothetical protein
MKDGHAPPLIVGNCGGCFCEILEPLPLPNIIHFLADIYKEWVYVLFSQLEI